MTEMTGRSLNAAYEAIKAKDLAKARDVLSAYLADNPNDVDAWWLYSYAVTDVEQGKEALQTVLRLDPAYPGARELLTELEESTVPDSIAAHAPVEMRPLSSLQPTIADDFEIDEEVEFDFEDVDDLPPLEDEENEERSASRLPLILGAALLVALLLAALFILPSLNSTAPEPTVVASTDLPTSDFSLGGIVTEAPTQEATADISIDATSEAVAATQTPSSGTTSAGDEAILGTLSEFDIVPGSLVTETTPLGETVTASVCGVSAELRTLVPTALAKFAEAGPNLPEGTDAVAVKFMNCVDNSVLRHIALGIADVNAYLEGTLTSNDLRSRLIPLP